MGNERQSTRVGLIVTGTVYVVVLGLMIAFLAVGCGTRAASTPKPVVEDILTGAVTEGNRTWVPTSSVDDAWIQLVVDRFEKSHPEWEFPFPAWRLGLKQSAGDSGSYIRGIWIDHRPKE